MQQKNERPMTPNTQAGPAEVGAGGGVDWAGWVAELSLSPNGMHEIRAGAVNQRERPLIAYAPTYALAQQIAREHNAIAKAVQP